MKIGGRKPEAPSIEILVLPREPELVQVKNVDGSLAFAEDGKTPITEEINRDVVLKAKAVLDFSEFEKVYPEPEPPKRQIRGQSDWTPNINDLGYKEEMKKFQAAQMQWLIISSLEATPDLEWEKVDKSKPETWADWIEEFKEAGFTSPEISKIINLVMSANSLNEDKYNEAKKRFLAIQGNGKLSVH